MKKVAKKITDLIGRTPLLELSNYNKKNNLKASLIAKLEGFNPTGSIKDRIAKSMIEDAIKKGAVTADTVIIEPTSGNTGIGLAAVAACYGLRVILTMPDTMSAERRNLLKAYGAELVLTNGALGMRGAIEKAKQMSAEIKNSFVPSQFENPANPQSHYDTTGVEIWEDTNGDIDIFVAGVGTGGTISGAGKYLKLKKPDIKIIAVEPAGSPVLSKGGAGTHKIQGIGAGFIPKTLNTKIYDEIITVKDEDAFKSADTLAKIEGVLAGISSGAAIWAASQVAVRVENKGKRIIVILPDTGTRYLSTQIFS